METAERHIVRWYWQTTAQFLRVAIRSTFNFQHSRCKSNTPFDWVMSWFRWWFLTGGTLTWYFRATVCEIVSVFSVITIRITCRQRFCSNANFQYANRIENANMMCKQAKTQHSVDIPDIRSDIVHKTAATIWRKKKCQSIMPLLYLAHTLWRSTVMLIRMASKMVDFFS